MTRKSRNTRKLTVLSVLSVSVFNFLLFSFNILFVLLQESIRQLTVHSVLLFQNIA